MNNQPPTTSSRDLTGRELGDYRVLRRLGTGGMAEVYLAEQLSLGRQVALKVLREQFVGDASYVQRFSNEARAAASLVHPNIVQIYEVGQAQSVHFIAQEYVPGKNLAQVMEREGAFDQGLVLDILRQVTSALCRAHEAGIVHRDLKPENILLNHSGEVKVADFGLARLQNADAATLTQVGVAMGTPLYMSPEQIEGRPVDVRSDIYSLGITCYHLLSGDPPYTGDTALAIAMRHLNSAPQPLENVRQDLSSGLARIVHRMISKKPEQRPVTPSELLAELRDLASVAAKEGWADGSGNWSLAERIAAGNSPSAAGAQLGDLMKASSQLRLSRRKWGRLAGGLILAALLGGAIAVATRPRFYLAGREDVAVPTRESPGAQLYHAKINDSETAWRAVWEKHQDLDPFLHQLARQGLVRHLLLVAQEYKKAEQILRQFEAQIGQGDASQQLTAFTMAGLCIAYEQLGDQHKAREAYARLTPDMKDELRRGEPQIYELLQATLRNLGE